MEGPGEEAALLKDGRRLLAVNAGEQKRLEKLQRHIEKKRREKERMLSRAQREAMIKFYENAGKELDGFLLVEKIHKREKDEGGQQSVVQCMDSFRGQETISTENPTLKDTKYKQKRKQQKLAMQENESKSLLPGLELTVLSLKSESFQRRRSRSWSSPSVGRHDQNHNEKLTHEDSNPQRKQSEEVKTDHFLEDEGSKIPEERPEKPLSAILPPLILPPLRDHRRPSLQEYNKNFYKSGNNSSLNYQKSLKEQYNELAECRYLRVYQRKRN